MEGYAGAAGLETIRLGDGISNIGGFYTDSGSTTLRITNSGADVIVIGASTATIPSGVTLSIASGGVFSFASFSNARTFRENVGYVTKFKSADTSRASTTSPTADPDLVTTVSSGQTWKFRIVAYVTSTSATPDIKFGPSGTSTVSHLRYHVKAWTNVTETVANGAFAAFNTGFTVNLDGTRTYIIELEGTATFNGNGTFGFFWSQNVSDLTAMVVQQNSTAEFVRLN